MRFDSGSHLTQAIRTVAFHKNDWSLPFFTAKIVTLPFESKHLRDLNARKAH